MWIKKCPRGLMCLSIWFLVVELLLKIVEHLLCDWRKWASGNRSWPFTAWPPICLLLLVLPECDMWSPRLKLLHLSLIVPMLSLLLCTMLSSCEKKKGEKKFFLFLAFFQKLLSQKWYNQLICQVIILIMSHSFVFWFIYMLWVCIFVSIVRRFKI